MKSLTGSGIFRAKVSATQNEGEIFAPIHWSKSTSSSATVCSIINAACDPFSGQPEFKITPVRAMSIDVKTEAVVVTAEPIQTERLNMAEIVYWSKKKLEHGYLYNISSRHRQPDLCSALCKALLKTEQPMTFSTSSLLRQINFESGVCNSTFEICEDKLTSLGSWQDELIGLHSDHLDAHRFIRGEAGPNRSDIICACKQISRSAILNAIDKDSHTNVRSLSSCTSAGTGCGSCMSELEEILAEHRINNQIPIKEVGIG
ncbi:(2Fe-2S)-binding protein [Veronia nyctiphanis]|uniref:(2Fe-2S)-binding protein n=1 Tax=Veronia nyctiphanis TaxID=1278244 RepID=UPI001F420494|nr:(2Fe-2S)-binding protein [Veronia nyctiphanis]